MTEFLTWVIIAVCLFCILLAICCLVGFWYIIRRLNKTGDTPAPTESDYWRAAAQEMGADETELAQAMLRQGVSTCPDCGAVAWGNLRCNTCVSNWEMHGAAGEDLRSRIMAHNTMYGGEPISINREDNDDGAA